MRCLYCVEIVPEKGMEKHLREKHRLTIFGEPLPMPWWWAVVGLAGILWLLYLAARP